MYSICTHVKIQYTEEEEKSPRIQNEKVCQVTNSKSEAQLVPREYWWLPYEAVGINAPPLLCHCLLVTFKNRVG
jgi:hypothetical protein